MAHGIKNCLDAQIVRNLLPGARRLAEGQNIGRGCFLGSFCNRFCRSGGAVIKCHDELIPTVFKNRLREAMLCHGPANGRDAGVAVFRTGEDFGHNGKGGVAQIRLGDAQLLHRHAAI